MQSFSFLDLWVSPDWVGYSGFTVPFKTQSYDAKAPKWKVKCRHQNQETMNRGMGEVTENKPRTIYWRSTIGEKLFSLEAMFCFKSELTKQTTCYSAFECQLS
jgi:hypothetical protein